MSSSTLPDDTGCKIEVGALMSFGDALVLAVIPARGGSVGIPRKNLTRIGGGSLVGLAASLAVSIDWIDAVVVSTDDEEIRKEAVRHGATAPFRRPDALSGAKTSSIDTWRHAWIESETAYNKQFSISLLLEPTSPMRRAEDLERTVELLLQTGAAAAATVSRTPAHFTPQKTLTIDASGTINFFFPDGHQYALRQRIPAYYHRNGICYAVRRDTLLTDGTIIENDCRPVIIDRPVVNIDEVIDLKFAAFLMREEKDQTSFK